MVSFIHSFIHDKNSCHSKMQMLGLTPDSQNQKLEGQGPASQLNRPLSDSDALSSVRTTHLQDATQSGGRLTSWSSAHHLVHSALTTLVFFLPIKYSRLMSNSRMFRLLVPLPGMHFLRSWYGLCLSIYRSQLRYPLLRGAFPKYLI